MKSVAKSFEIKSEFYENEISRISKTVVEKDREFALLEIQLSKANYDNDQLKKTNENLISDNKFMMEEIGSLKKILKKIDDWKLKIFHLMREEKIEKEILRNIISDFPSYKEIKENFENLNKNNFNEISNINHINHLNMSGTIGKEYLLSSFNKHDNNIKRERERNFSEEKYYNPNRNIANNNLPEKDVGYFNNRLEEKFEQGKSPQRQRKYLEDKVIKIKQNKIKLN